MSKLSCKPRRQGDQLACHVCGRAWDVNEEAPAECVPARLERLRSPVDQLQMILEEPRHVQKR